MQLSPRSNIPTGVFILRINSVGMGMLPGQLLPAWLNTILRNVIW